MNTYKTIAVLIAAATLLLASGSAVADDLDHDHEHSHPDLDIEAEGTQLELHGHPVLHNHEHYAFIDVGGGNWVTEHDGLTWPGIGAEDGTLPASSTVDLIIETSLYYWDGTSAGGFAAVDDEGYLTVKASAFGTAYTVDGSSGAQTLAQFISVDSEGGVHMHPIWQLWPDGDDDPLDGAWLLGVSVDADGYNPAEMKGLLFHKGLEDAAYEAAVDEAIAVGVPEPATLAMLGLGGLALLRRRRTS